MSKPNHFSPTSSGSAYFNTGTPILAQPVDAIVMELPDIPPIPKVSWMLYSSCLLGMVLPLHYGWSTSQINYVKFNKLKDCDARPVVPGTCIMFPGHTKMEWIFVVNAWVFGGMIGALLVGVVADKCGRKRTLMYTCGLIIAAAILQASAFNLWQFVIGRLVAGFASGAITGNLGSYNNEVAPPHLRAPLGAILQSGIALGILLVDTTHFYLNFEDGWRIIAGFPIVLAAIFLSLAPFVMVESPVWLLLHGKRPEAMLVLTQLYGAEHAETALQWIEPTKKANADVSSVDGVIIGGSKKSEKPISYGDLLSPALRLQFLIVVGLAIMQKLTGINAIFYYSSDMFARAGLSNPRVGAIIIAVFNTFPCFFSGVLARWVGNRRMLLIGLCGMLASTIGITLSLTCEISLLTIVCMATFVMAFTLTIGPLSWVFIADIFPDSGRAAVTSVSVGIMWFANLIVGIGYPYVSTALGDYAYMPFAVIIVVSLLFSYALVPDTTGKTNAEIQDEFRARREGTPLPRPA
jgi:sugar porter (SP) family MFS transporter